MRVVAIIAAYNEVDIISEVVEALVEQQVGVYLIDHGSTDGTAAKIEGVNGVIGVERMEPTGPHVRWADVLARKQELATSIDADWFIHHDADEFRESPWPGLSLREAIALVDRSGYNAIDFELFNFLPTPGEVRGHSVRESFRYYALPQAWDKTQVKCWKRGAVDLVSSGGHEARFANRRIFPLRFLLRHYPLRDPAQAKRKILAERRDRFDLTEKERGWHKQYDAFSEEHPFVFDPSALQVWDAQLARVAVCVRTREVERLEGDPAMNHWRELEAERLLQSARAELDEMHDRWRRASVALDQRNKDYAAALAMARECDVNLRQAHEREQALMAELSRIRAEVEAAQAGALRLHDELQAMRDSQSWRVTAPLRALYDRLPKP